MVAERKVLDAYVQLSARGTSAVGSAMKTVESSARQAYGAMSRIAEIAVGNAMAAGFTSLTSAVASVPSAMISANASYEQASVGLEVLLGSAEAAKKRIADLNTFAASTPFELPGILQASKQLEMAQVPAEEHQKVLKMTGDMAAAAGVDISELGMWVSRAYQQIQAGEPFGEAAHRMGELGVLSVDARAKLEQMTQSGASSTEVWNEFSEAMKRFEGMTDRQAKTFNGLMSTMTDGVSNTLRVFGEPMFNMVKSGVDEATSLMSGDAWMASAQQAGEMVVGGFQAISDFYAPILDGAEQIGQAFLSWFDGVDVLGSLRSGFESFYESIQVLGELQISIYTATIEIVGQLASLIGDGLTAALGAVGLTGQQVGDGLGAVFDWIIESVRAVAAAIRNWDLSFQYAWVYAKNFGANLIEMLGAFVENTRIVFTNLPQFAIAAGKAYIQIAQNIAEAWAELAYKITTYIGELLSGNFDAKFELNFTPLMTNVKEQFAGLPDLVEAQTKTARERFGKEMAAIDSEWNTREKKREDRIAQRKADQKKLIADAAGLNKEEATGPDDQKKLAAKKGEGGGKKEKAVAITDVAAFWEKLQGASTKAGEKKAEQQRDKALSKADQANKLLRDIADRVGPARLA